MITDKQVFKFYKVYHEQMELSEIATSEFDELLGIDTTGNEETFCIRQTAAFKAALEAYECSKCCSNQ